MTVDVKVDDSILDALDALQHQLDDVETIIEGEALPLLFDHFAAKDGDGSSHKSASRLGADKTGLYAEFGSSLKSSTSDGSVTLTINHIAAPQRYYGGKIEPQNFEFLSIPVAADAYGKSISAGDFTESLLYLVNKARTGGYITYKDKPDHILFVLAKSVNQPGDPSVLPDDDDFTSALLDSVSDAIDWEAING